MRKWFEIELGELRQVMHTLRNAKQKIVESQSGHQTQWANEQGIVVLRLYKHRRSHQCLIHTSINEHLTRARAAFLATKEASIYAA